MTMCYATTFAELSLMTPKAGGISTYTLASIGHFPAIIATLSGYVIPNILRLPVWYTPGSKMRHPQTWPVK